ncbi:MAG: hypothetical protein K0S32_3081 [Bacteroidetes bacterium]|jgi:hypothetical protein|nr:hypothetical protein [Bacteroidota bacterium]
MEGVPEIFQTKSTTISKGDKIKTEIGKGSGQTTYLQEGNKVTIVSADLCCTTTTEEMAKEPTKGSGSGKIENVKTEFPDDTTTFLKHKCKKAIITYDIKTSMIKVTNTMVIWYTTDIPSHNENASVSDSQVMEDYAELAKALAGIKGTILSNVSTPSMGTARGVTEAVEIDYTKTGEGDFTIDTSKCKKMLTYKEFVKESNKRAARMNAMNSGIRMH